MFGVFVYFIYIISPKGHMYSLFQEKNDIT